MNKMFKINIVLFVTLLLGVLTILLIPSKVLAQTCESDGAYGQNCTYVRNFEITKKVRLEGNDSWRSKVVNVKEGEVIEFRIEVRNIGNSEVDNMSLEDFLPDELKRIDGDDLTQEWSDFEVDEKVSFTIKARIRSEEFDRNDTFEKCVVNRAELEYDGSFEGSDVATVCYGIGEIVSLPATGATSTGVLTFTGIVSTALGLILGKRK